MNLAYFVVYFENIFIRYAAQKFISIFAADFELCVGVMYSHVYNFVLLCRITCLHINCEGPQKICNRFKMAKIVDTHYQCSGSQPQIVKIVKV